MVLNSLMVAFGLDLVVHDNAAVGVVTANFDLFYTFDYRLIIIFAV